MSHAHTPTHDADTQVQIDDPEPGSTWFISIAGTIVFAAIVLAVSVIFFAARNSEAEVRVIDERVLALEQLRTQQKQLLADFQRYDVTLPDGKVVQRIRIPISRAMELTAVELSTTPKAVTTPAGGGER